ncbi:MAG: ABC transporter substrate-binding protein, partial [Candidatus Edwardsbacteria bacterium]|nr:ABC transporter substrate-binding protein [Candidatus Edwardsbacteria bacterium]
MKNVLIAIALFILVAGCAKQQGAPAFTITDDVGRTIGFTKHPGRIVSLAPNTTEMIYALGGQDRLVGVTSWCNYPPEAKEKPVIGDAISFNAEKLLALKPDLVIMVGTRQSPALARLEALDVPALALDPKTPEEILADIIKIGRALGAEPKADSLINEIRTTLAWIKNAADSCPDSQRPLVFAE